MLLAVLAAAAVALAPAAPAADPTPTPTPAPPAATAVDGRVCAALTADAIARLDGLGVVREIVPAPVSALPSAALAAAARARLGCTGPGVDAPVDVRLCAALRLDLINDVADRLDADAATRAALTPTRLASLRIAIGCGPDAPGPTPVPAPGGDGGGPVPVGHEPGQVSVIPAGAADTGEHDPATNMLWIFIPAAVLAAGIAVGCVAPAMRAARSRRRLR